MRNSAMILGDAVQELVDIHLPQRGIISIRWHDIEGLEIHVSPEYFDLHYGNRTQLTQPHGSEGTAQVSVKTDSGATIFCLKHDMYKVELSRA